MAPATVYLVTNTVNGHAYVGVTRFTAEHRWAQHVTKAGRGRARTYLHRAIAKHGTDVFSVEAVASCLSVECAGDVERAVIQRLRPVYNQTNGGEITSGRRLTVETVEKMRAKAIGRKSTPEQNAANRERTAERWQQDASFRKTALAALSRGRVNVDQQKRITAAAKSARERVWTVESRAKLSASRMGRVHSREVIERIRQSKKKPVECIELKTVFDSASEAAEGTGVSVTSVSRVCLGAMRSANGLTFQYVNC